ncbi:hypothetical protein EPUS_02783 [Endocarpon pusillum Z07020]|uniref:LYC1 C-terminal domain-containing protein n=1 Tax=Endocarpon pusillum (strain Z07020 / HMAS-L-300199) TaxID=1263415 RepID=U1FU70_ENDPU|nr:uncharacterized protein EPUS_02783 [Endocarpon pusillum Z07020]ERF68327.1 hypothetical protein EPUS_02783 [Endocarpon pusillum Z07020]
MGSFAMKPDISVVETTAPVPIPSSELPASSSPSITLVPATLLERYQCWHINSHSWRGPLSTEQYISREAFLEHQLLTREGKITYWILTDTFLSVGADGARPILAACETLRKEGYLGRNGNLRKLVTHGVGSVFCRKEYRGRGYASRMMTELGKSLETWQQEKGTKASFSVLWSDIGRSFYAAHGWKAMSNTRISLPVVSGQNSLQTQNKPDCSGVRDLNAQDLRDRICPKAIAILETNLRLRSEHRPNIPHIAIRPDYDHMEWQHARENFQAKTLFDRDPNIKGAEDLATGCALIWCRVWGEVPQNNKLHILHTVIPTDVKGDAISSIAALLLRAQMEAKTWDMHGGVELWSPTPDVVNAAQSLAGIERVQTTIRDKESVCSLRWIGGEGEEVEWVADERYCWC